MKIYNAKNGYEAPSTAYENSGEPTFSIRGCGSHQAVPCSSLFPSQLTLPVFIRPVPHGPLVQLHVNDKSPCAIYTRPAWSCVDLLSAGLGTATTQEGERIPLYEGSPYNLVWETPGTLYKHTFLVLSSTVRVHMSIQDPYTTLYPYGGQPSPDPLHCQQLYLQPTSLADSSHALLVAANTFDTGDPRLRYFTSSPEKQPPSLAQALRQGCARISLDYEGQRCPYRSYDYYGPWEGKISVLMVRDPDALPPA